MNKPKHFRPGLYTMFFEQLKDIAKEYGYNLLLHGSMNRDLDLVAVPWVNNPKPEQEMILEFQEYLTGKITVNSHGKVLYRMLPGGRHSYIIELNRGNRHGEWARFYDCQYYLDISVTPLKTKQESNDFLKDYKQQLIIPVISNQEEIINSVCPECGSTNLFDLETKIECEDCGFVWNK